MAELHPKLSEHLALCTNQRDGIIDGERLIQCISDAYHRFDGKLQSLETNLGCRDTTVSRLKAQLDAAVDFSRNTYIHVGGDHRVLDVGGDLEAMGCGCLEPGADLFSRLPEALSSWVKDAMGRVRKAAEEGADGRCSFSVPGGERVRLALLPDGSYFLLLQREARAGDNDGHPVRDSLTGLTTHSFLSDRFHHLKRSVAHRSKGFSLIHIALRRFGELELPFSGFENVGADGGDDEDEARSLGDLILIEISRRLEVAVDDAARIFGLHALSSEAILSRIATDEFVVLMPEVYEERAATFVAECVQVKLERPIALPKGAEVFPDVGIGISMYPRHGRELDDLLDRARTATREAHGADGHRRPHASEMSEEHQSRRRLEHKLREGVHAGELELYYQPQVSLFTDSVVGLEALIRWNHPRKGVLPPGVFMPVAEASDLILSIGRWVIEAACRQIRNWLDEGLDPVRVHVNLSSQQLRDHDVIHIIESALKDNDADPDLLGIEVTETALIEEPSIAREVLSEIHKMGVYVSLDDFGTGYSSLSHLHQFDVDAVKIDRSFVQAIAHHEEIGAKLTRAMIALAHSLELEVVAEGAETDEQADFLRLSGCDFLQGYLIARPLPVDGAQRFLHPGPPSRRSQGRKVQLPARMVMVPPDLHARYRFDETSVLQ